MQNNNQSNNQYNQQFYLPNRCGPPDILFPNGGPPHGSGFCRVTTSEDLQGRYYIMLNGAKLLVVPVDGGDRFVFQIPPPMPLPATFEPVEERVWDPPNQIRIGDGIIELQTKEDAEKFRRVMDEINIPGVIIPPPWNDFLGDYQPNINWVWVGDHDLGRNFTTHSRSC